MSAHSYGRSSLASPHGAPRAPLEGRSGSHVYESSTTTSQSEAESRDRRDSRRSGGGSSGAGGSGGGAGGGGAGGGVGLPAGDSFASSHYNDVYGDASSVGSRTPNQAVENYFAEQPSGRNLLHVLPPGASRESHDSVIGGGAGVLAQASPGLGSYAEPASGRGLVHDQSGSDIDDDDDDDGGGHGAGGGDGRGGGTVMSSPSESEASSAWNDTDAQSIPPSHDYHGGGGGGLGRYSESYDDAPESSLGAAEEDAPRRSSPVVREVEVYEDDLMVSEGSDTESRMTYGSEMTYGHDTAAGGSVVSYAAAAGPEGGRAGGSATPASRAPGQPQESLVGQRYGSSASSIASRVIAPRSELGSTRQAIPPQESWRNSPLPGGTVGAVERMLSGETTDSSVMDQQTRDRDRESSHGGEDGDFGAVWLADRAHARQFDAAQNNNERRG